MALKLIIREFPGKCWTVSGLNKLLRTLRNTGSTIRCQESGRPCSARTDNHVVSVNNLNLNEEGAPKSHRTTRQILRETEIHHSWHTVSFVRIWSWNAWRSVVRKNSLLQTVRCTELAHENCYAIPSIRCGLHIFHWGACVKASGRHYEHLTWSPFTVLCRAL